LAYKYLFNNSNFKSIFLYPYCTLRQAPNLGSLEDTNFLTYEVLNFNTSKLMNTNHLLEVQKIKPPRPSKKLRATAATGRWNQLNDTFH
jgi:hypothetical protein